MASINNFFDLLTSPSQSGDSTGVQAVVGLIALWVLVWGVRGLVQWKAVGAGRRARYIFISVVAGIVFVTSARQVFHNVQALHGQNRPISSSSLGYSVERGTCAAGYDQPVSGCATTVTANPNTLKGASK
jgi:hypothetical protein